MLAPLFLTALLLSSQQMTGIVAGSVVAPDGAPMQQPVVVILLPPTYMTLWETDVQERLDNYWERYKPLFAKNKEFFLEVSRRAYQESLQYLVTKIQRDERGGSPSLIQHTSTEGRFEFRNLPLGYYKVLAAGKVRGQDLVWQESIKIDSAVPMFLQVKTHIP